MSLLGKVSLIEDNVPVSDITDILIVDKCTLSSKQIGKGVEMKRNYKYEKEMLHWLDGGEVEQRAYDEENWEPFDGEWVEHWQYRIAEKPKEERWLYVVIDPLRKEPFLSESGIDGQIIGKIRLEDV